MLESKSNRRGCRDGAREREREAGENRARAAMRIKRARKRERERNGTKGPRQQSQVGHNEPRREYIECHDRLM